MDLLGSRKQLCAKYILHSKVIWFLRNEYIFSNMSNLPLQNCMVELQKHSALEESTSLTEDEICDKVLGTRPGYIKGLGHGVLPISTSNCSQFDLSNVILRAENAERCNAELTTQLQQQILQTQEQNRKIEELESWRNTMATRWDTFMRQFSGDGSSTW